MPSARPVSWFRNHLARLPQKRPGWDGNRAIAQVRRNGEEAAEGGITPLRGVHMSNYTARCPRCHQPCSTAEIAAYRKCEMCWCGANYYQPKLYVPPSEARRVSNQVQETGD